MMRKRTAGTILSSVVLLTTGALPVWADGAVPATATAGTVVSTGAAAGQQEAAPLKAKISKEAALAKLKAAVPIPAGFKLTNTSFNTDAWINENGSWQFNFEKNSNNQVYSYLSGTVDAGTGRLIGFNIYTNDPDKPAVYPPKLDHAAAKKLAFDLLSKMNPGEAASTVYDSSQDETFIPPLKGEVSYNFRFDRAVDGVRYPTDGITFTIDGTGALTGYQFMWHNSAKFEPMKPVIAAADALSAYKKVSKPYLLYTLTQGKKAKVALAYHLDAYPLDAVTGKPVASGGSLADLKPLTAKPLAAMPARGQDLTEEKAADIARKVLSIPASAVVENSNYNERVMGYDNGQLLSAWQVTFRSGNAGDKNMVRYNASVNADNGDLLSFNVDSPTSWQPLTAEEIAKKLDDAKLKKAAEDFILKALPQYSNQLALLENNDAMYLAKAAMDPTANNSRSVYYNFRRVVNGIPTEMDYVNVSVDRVKGTILNYWGTLSPIDYPSVKPAVIDADKALDLLLTPYRMELQYQDAPPTDYSLAWKDRKPAKLVYMPIVQIYDNLYLDAQTGQWTNRETGEVTQVGKMVAVDIAGHPAQKELQLLIDYKALDVKDGKVNPEQIVTRGEFIKMLMIALGNGGYNPYYLAGRANSYKDVLATSAYFPYVEAAVDAGILDRSTDTLNPDASMTREEMAGLLVRALGFDKLAAKSELFKLDIKDADQVKLKGQAAIVLALGIMDKAADGSFQPAADVTRAQAAVTFYKFLQVRPTMQSSPIRMPY